MERFRKMLIDLADTTGTIHNGSLYRLHTEFNTRYAGETKPIGRHTTYNYIRNAVEAGWLSSAREKDIIGRLVLTLLPVEL